MTNSSMWSGLGCNNSSISTTINNATTETNLAVQSYILETSCFPLVLSRIIFYALFLLLSSCLLFSFVRHHVKYNRFDILRCKSNIATERHRVVIAMSLGCFFRSLSFVVDGEYLYNSDVAFYVHVFLRVLKDICYVQSFSLVVVFWLTLLKTVGGGRTSHGNSRSHRHQWDAAKIQVVAVGVFATCRVVVAILRCIAENGTASFETSNFDIILYGILSISYFVFFVVAIVHGTRLHKRLTRVGIVVRRNLYRLRGFMIVEFIFAVLLAVSTLSRIILFSQSLNVGGYSRGTHPTLYFILRNVVKGSEFGMVGTLTLLMIARSSTSNTASRESDAVERERREERESRMTEESGVNSNSDVVSEFRSKRKHSRNDTALFDRRSFTEEHSSSMFDSLDNDDDTTFASDLEIVDPTERTKNIVSKVPATETSVKK